MDLKLEKALEFSNLRMTQSIERRRLKEKLKSDLTYAHNGGVFVLDRTLLTFLISLKDKFQYGSAVILDDKMNPVEIKNVTEFADSIWELYFKTTQQYFWDINTLKQKRKVQDVVGL